MRRLCGLMFSLPLRLWRYGRRFVFGKPFSVLAAPLSLYSALLRMWRSFRPDRLLALWRALFFSAGRRCRFLPLRSGSFLRRPRRPRPVAGKSRTEAVPEPRGREEHGGGVLFVTQKTSGSGCEWDKPRAARDGGQRVMSAPQTGASFYVSDCFPFS